MSALKNNGKKLEEHFSKKIHGQFNKNLKSIILIDSNFLRSFDCGQIDLCTIESYSKRQSGDYVKIYEVKSYPAISMSQMKRLQNSATLLTEIFGKSTIIEVLYPDF